MPGIGSYGPGGKWIYERAAHIRSKNPDMEESTSFAIATQQAHKLGKSNKGHRTAAGVKRAKQKYSLPAKMYRKTAKGPSPAVGKQKTAMLHGLFDELEKIAQAPTGASLGIPGAGTAKSLGIPGANPGGGSTNPAAGQLPPPPPTPVSPAGSAAAGAGVPAGGGSAPSPGSLLSPARRRPPGTGTLSAAESKEVAPPTAADFGG